jgi:hypothetical protein
MYYLETKNIKDEIFSLLSCSGNVNTMWISVDVANILHDATMPITLKVIVDVCLPKKHILINAREELSED